MTEDSIEKSLVKHDDEIQPKPLLETVSETKGTKSRVSFEEFTDERTLISYDAFGNHISDFKFCSLKVFS